MHNTTENNQDLPDAQDPPESSSTVQIDLLEEITNLSAKLILSIKLNSKLIKLHTVTSLTINSVSLNVENLKAYLQYIHIAHYEQLNSTTHNLGTSTKLDLIDMKDEVMINMCQ